MASTTRVIPIVKVPLSVSLTLKEYDALGEAGDNIPAGVDPDDWHSNRVIAISDSKTEGKVIRNFLAEGQLAEDTDTFRLGLPVKADGSYQWLTITKTDLLDPADFTTVKDPFPVESKIVALTATSLEVLL